MENGSPLVKNRQQNDCGDGVEWVCEWEGDIHTTNQTNTNANNLFGINPKQSDEFHQLDLTAQGRSENMCVSLIRFYFFSPRSILYLILYIYIIYLPSKHFTW